MSNVRSLLRVVHFSRMYHPLHPCSSKYGRVNVVLKDILRHHLICTVQTVQAQYSFGRRRSNLREIAADGVSQ